MKPLEKVTESTRFRSVLQEPSVKPFKKSMRLGPTGINFFYDALPLGALYHLSPAWEHTGIPMGIDFFLQEARAGKVQSLPIYTRQELAQDPTKEKAELLFLPGRPGAPYAIIMPGGAYFSVAISVEGLPVGARLHELGYSVFFLRYRCGRNGELPKPFYDLQASVRYITAHAQALQIDPQGYGIFGFSAGGHVAASMGTDNFGYLPQGLPKPGAMILGYPLLSLEERNFSINFVIRTYIGRKWRETLPPTYILNHMDKNYPPTYIWQCRDDKLLPFSGNSEAFQRKARQLGVPCCFRAVNKGGHGLGLGLGSEAEGWLEEAVTFWEAHRTAAATSAETPPEEFDHRQLHKYRASDS